MKTKNVLVFTSVVSETTILKNQVQKRKTTSHRKGERIMAREIIPGEQIITVISSMKGGSAEKVLDAIAHPEINPTNRREFGDWENDMCFGTVLVYHTGEKRELVLKKGVKDGLFLDDQEGVRIRKRFSLKHECSGGLCTIPIGSKISGRRMHIANEGEEGFNANSIANNIVGSWIIHGRNWSDSKGHTHYWPYGVDPNRKDKYDFELVDGRKQEITFGQLMEMGGVRSAHPGNWTAPNTLVSAAMGMPIILHEFQEYAGDDGYDVTRFNDEKISLDGDIWGPYATWHTRVMGNGGYMHDDFRQIAEQASSPFSFHIAATKAIFPKCTLASSMILEKLGEEKLLQVLTAIAQKDQERYYRLIDENGKTHRLVGFENGDLVFDEELTFSINDAPNNVLSTFKELAAIEANSTHVLKRIPRLVLDSHFYIVVFALMTTNNGASYHLGGTDMHRYLTEGPDAQMHTIRNERLFHVVREFFGAEKLKFVIYPSSELRLRRSSQYDFVPEKWNPDHWNPKVLV